MAQSEGRPRVTFSASPSHVLCSPVLLFGCPWLTHALQNPPRTPSTRQHMGGHSVLADLRFPGPRGPWHSPQSQEQLRASDIAGVDSHVRCPRARRRPRPSGPGPNSAGSWLPRECSRILDLHLTQDPRRALGRGGWTGMSASSSLRVTLPTL